MLLAPILQEEINEGHKRGVTGVGFPLQSFDAVPFVEAQQLSC